MEREAEEADFLKKYYHHSHRQHANEGAPPLQQHDNAPKITTAAINPSSSQDDDWPVQVRLLFCIHQQQLYANIDIP